MKEEQFITLKIKSKTAEEFRKFSRHLGKQQTDSLQLMLNFFTTNSLSPFDELGPNLTTLESKLKKRINALIAIIRDIEKTQIKPTLSMMQLLFQESAPKQPLLLEKKSQPVNMDQSAYLEIQQRNVLLQNETQQWRTITTDLIEKVGVSRTSFGKVQLRLLMSPQELEEIKNKIAKL